MTMKSWWMKELMIIWKTLEYKSVKMRADLMWELDAVDGRMQGVVVDDMMMLVIGVLFLQCYHHYNQFWP